MYKKLSAHTEYQWRRTKWITDWQQSLLRMSIGYSVHPKIQIRLGYGWIETFSYGDIPINSFGKQFTEKRVFEMATITDKVGLLDFSHRLMLEQRWVGKFNNPANKKKMNLFSVTGLDTCYGCK